MTDDERDQLLSDVLDGVATADDVARVDNDPDLAADLRLMRQAQSAMATPPAPVDATMRDTMIAAALDELAPNSPAAAPRATPEATAPVIDLAAQRAKRQRRLNLVGAAAAVVLVVGAAAVALRGGSSDDSDSTAAGDAESEVTAEAFSQSANDSEMADQDATTRAADDDAADGTDEMGGGLSQDALEEAESEEMAADDSAAEESVLQTIPSDSEADDVAEAAPVAPTPLVLLPLPAEPCRDALNEAVPDFDRAVEVFVDETTALLELFVGEESATVALELASCTVTVQFELGESPEPAE